MNWGESLCKSNHHHYNNNKNNNKKYKNAIEETITKGVPDNRLKATESVSIL